MPSKEQLQMLSLAAKKPGNADKLAKIGLISPVQPADPQFDAANGLALGQFVKEFGLAHEGNFDIDEVEKVLDLVNANAAPETPAVTGRLIASWGASAKDFKDLTLRLRARDFGGATRFVGDPVTADEFGLFKLPFDPKEVATLEVVAIKSPGAEPIALSKSLLGTDSTQLRALLADAALEPTNEFDRLMESVSATIGSSGALANAREDSGDSGHRDLTNLQAMTGWDARVIAVGAQAQRLQADKVLPAPVAYALGRAGVPLEPRALARIVPADLRRSLEEARDQGIVQLTNDDIGKALESHGLLARKEFLAQPLGNFGASLKTVIAGAAGNDAARFEQAIFDFSTAPEGDDRDLWQIARERQVSDTAIAKLKVQGQLGALTKGNAAMMDQLLQDLQGKPLARLVDLDLFKSNAWETKIRKVAPDDAALAKLLGGPADVPLKERLDFYAQHLAGQVRRAFPTQTLARQIGLGEIDMPAATRAEVVRVLEAGLADSIELGKAGVRSLTAKTQDEEAKKALKQLHRLYQITPDARALQWLWGAGFKSAFDISELSLDDFEDRVRRRWGLPEKDPDLLALLRLMHQKSKQVTRTTRTFYSHKTSTQLMPATPVLRGGSGSAAARQDFQDRYPTLASLAGKSQGECEHCRSVLSPAAYFVDLLRLIDRDPQDWSTFVDRYTHDHPGEAAPKKPFDVLNARRPDLAALPLTCENTHTSLPYIDIVNEILESIVLSGSVDVAAQDDREYSSQELAAEPRRMQPAAYKVLAARRYPMQLPFDLPSEMGRAYEPLVELAPGEAASHFSADGAAWERLGLSRVACVPLWADAGQLAAWPQLYGLADESQASIDKLRKTTGLSRTLGVTPHELRDIVRSQFLNPAIGVLMLLDAMHVRVSEARSVLAGLMPQAERAKFDAKLQAFRTRHPLFDPLPWMQARRADIDGLVVLSGTGDSFDDASLQQGGGAPGKLEWLHLNQFVRLMHHFKWTPAQADSWLTALYPGGLARLRSDDKWPERTRVMLLQVDAVRRLQGLLGLDDASDFFIPSLWGDLSTGGLDPVYSRLFLRDNEAPAFDSLDGNYLVDTTQKVKGHLPVLAARLQMDPAAIALVVDGEQALSLVAITSLYRHSRLAKALGMAIADLIALKTMSGVNPFMQAGDDPASHLPASAATIQFVEMALALRAAKVTVPQLNAWLKGNAATSQQTDAAGLMTALRTAFVSPTGEIVPNWSAGAAAQVSAWLKFDSSAWLDLLSLEPQELPLGQAQTLLEAVRAYLLATDPTANGVGATCKERLERMRTVAEAARVLQLAPRELVFAVKHAQFFAGTAADLIATTQQGQQVSVMERFQAWMGLIQYAVSRQGIGAKPQALQALQGLLGACVAQPQDLAATHEALAEFVGITAAQSAQVLAQLWPDAQARTVAVATWGGLQKTLGLARLCRKTRQSPPTLLAWTTIASDESFDVRLAAAQSLREAARARYGRASWLEAVRPCADRLRQRRRDALTAYVIEKDAQLDSIEDLYERYLIDPGMEPVVLTSRVRVAIAAVQLFIHRCFLKLEDVAPSSIKSKEWEWMRRYRVWEANRKIFLYPENWLEPEFRDDRTHLFRRLEGSLLQSDVTDEAAESAIVDYMREFQSLASLDIMAMSLEQPPEGIEDNTVHVLGRTHTAPHKYYNRRRAHEEWTPWDPVDADIQGDHVVAAFWKNRLHVFWLLFSDASSQAAAAGAYSGTVTTPATTRTRTVRLAWAECFKGEWKTHHAGGSGMVFNLPPDGRLDLHATLDIERVNGEDGAIYVVVGKSEESERQAFKVISAFAPVVALPHTAPLPATSLIDVALSMGRYRAGAGDLMTNFGKVSSVTVDTQATPPGGNAPTPDPTKLLTVRGGGMNVTLLDAPPLDKGGESNDAVAATWQARLAPFFLADADGTWFAVPRRELEKTVETEKWFDYDWKDFRRNRSNRQFAPLFPPKPQPRTLDPWFKPVKPGFPGIGNFDVPLDFKPVFPKPKTNADWLTANDTKIKFGNAMLGTAKNKLEKP